MDRKKDYQKIKRTSRRWNSTFSRWKQEQDQERRRNL